VISRRSRYLATAAMATAALLVTGGAAAASGRSSPTRVTRGFDTHKRVTITIADGWGDTPSVAAAFAGVVHNFERKYPNVRVNLETEGSNAYNEAINLRAASNNPPDVFMLSTAGYGPGFYDLAKAGDLEPLDAYAKAYGWYKRFSPTALEVFRLNRKTGQWGSGALYGLPEQNTMIGVFYNKKILHAIGFSSPPTTFAQFETTLALAKEKGYTPIAATKDAYVHDEMGLWDAFSSSEQPINNWVYGKSGTFASSANLRAVETLLTWQKDGYLQAGSEGLGYGNAVGALTGGSALYFFAGPWLDGAVQSSLGPDAGFMQLPSVSKRSPVGGGPSSPLVISSKSKHLAVDAAFLNFFNSTAESNYLVQHGWGPPGATVNPSVARTLPVTAEVLAILRRVEAPGGAGTTPYINWASPAVNNDIYSGLESVLANQMTPAQYLAQIQNDWVQFKAQRRS